MGLKIKNFLKVYRYELGLFLLLLINILTRFNRLSFPFSFVWDETYFANFAHNYLAGTNFYDVHPPLGKLIIGLGIRLFGFNSFGWRIMNAFFGLIFILVIYLVAFRLTKNKLVAFFASFLLTFDTFILVESRLALLNIYLISFGLLAFYFFLRFLEKRSPLNLALFGIFGGLSFSVKWLGLFTFALLAILLLLIWAKKINFPKKANISQFPLYYLLAGLVIILALTYFGVLGISAFLLKQPFKEVASWHLSALSYHLALKTNHPSASVFWSWPLMIKPIWFYFREEGSKIFGILEIGNVFVWWAGALSILYLAYFSIKKALKEYLLIVGGFLVNFLPFIFINRVMFIYHYFFALIFSVLALSIVLVKIWQKKKYRILVVGFLCLVVAFFIFFYPLAVGFPISRQFYQSHLWFPSWF